MIDFYQIATDFCRECFHSIIQSEQPTVPPFFASRGSIVVSDRRNIEKQKSGTLFSTNKTNRSTGKGNNTDERARLILFAELDRVVDNVWNTHSKCRQWRWCRTRNGQQRRGIDGNRQHVPNFPVGSGWAAEATTTAAENNDCSAFL